MFSSTTIASSTTRPIASTSASSVSVLIEKPSTSISVNAPTSDTGIVTSGTSIARQLRRKNRHTAATSSTASQMVENTASIERSMNTVVSLAMVIDMPSGSSACSRGIISSRPRLRSSGLATDCLMRPIDTAGRPMKRTEVRSLSGATSTRPTSRMRTG